MILVWQLQLVWLLEQVWLKGASSQEKRLLRRAVGLRVLPEAAYSPIERVWQRVVWSVPRHVEQLLLSV